MVLMVLAMYEALKSPENLSALFCVVVQEGDDMVEGFRIVSVTPKKLHISFDYKYGKYADFPPPPYDLTIIETGEGTRVSTMQNLVCLRSYLPLWTPLIFSSKVPKGQVGVEMTEVEIREHLGELHSLQRQVRPCPKKLKVTHLIPQTSNFKP